jgi:hypothetical protein
MGVEVGSGRRGSRLGEAAQILSDPLRSYPARGGFRAARRGGFGLGLGSAGSAASHDAANAPHRSNSPHSGWASSGRGGAGDESGVAGWRGLRGIASRRVAPAPAQALRRRGSPEGTHLAKAVRPLGRGRSPPLLPRVPRTVGPFGQALPVTKCSRTRCGTVNLIGNKAGARRCLDRLPRAGSWLSQRAAMKATRGSDRCMIVRAGASHAPARAPEDAKPEQRRRSRVEVAIKGSRPPAPRTEPGRAWSRLTRHPGEDAGLQARKPAAFHPPRLALGPLNTSWGGNYRRCGREERSCFVLGACAGAPSRV